MSKTVHILQLYKPLSGDIFRFTTKAIQGTLDVTKENQLSTHSQADSIAEGMYLFIQGIQKTTSTEQWKVQLEAAELLWLESLWREIPLLGNSVYIRTLTEDSHTIFQLFRPIAHSSMQYS